MYSSLEEILKLTPHIRLATPKDNQQILDFYHQTEMKGKDQAIKYGRGPDFFTFLHERCANNLVFTLWNDANFLEGVAVVSYRMGFINEELVTVGYLGDLRVNMNRKLIREWRKMYSLFIKHSIDLPETHHCRYYQTVIIDSNLKAKANLVKTQIPNLHYEPLESYKMINIIGRIKLRSKSQYQISMPEQNDQNELISFSNSFDKKRMFGKYWTEELPHRLRFWKNFSKNNIRVIKNQQNEIMALASFWNPIETKQVITTKVPTLFKIIVPILNLLPFIELKELPTENKPINILYLNQIVFNDQLTVMDKKEILKNLLDNIFDQDFNMLAYCDFSSQNLLENDFCYIKHSIDMTMYTVHYIDEKQNIRDLIKSTTFTNQDPGFEMALV